MKRRQADLVVLGETLTYAGTGFELRGLCRADSRPFNYSSTYEDVSRDWMLTAVYGQDGRVLAQAREWARFASPKWI